MRGYLIGSVFHHRNERNTEMLIINYDGEMNLLRQSVMASHSSPLTTLNNGTNPKERPNQSINQSINYNRMKIKEEKEKERGGQAGND